MARRLSHAATSIARGAATGVALFLDRDGVINAKAPEGRYVTDWADFHFLPGVPEALARIRALAPNAVVIIVTNQRGIARGMVASETVDDIHARMRDQLRAIGADVDAVEVCPHEAGTCECRKPGLGLFRRAMADFPSIAASASVVVGDSISDVMAGYRLGARTCLVGTQSRRHDVRREAHERGARIDLEADSLADLVADGRFLDWIGATEPGPR
jgi:D-glycero-D-manno-heptose 1,7-bisphosphate phosphatase